MKVANKITRDGLENICEPLLDESLQRESIENSVSPTIELLGLWIEMSTLQCIFQLVRKVTIMITKNHQKINSESSAEEEYSDEES